MPGMKGSSGKGKAGSGAAGRSPAKSSGTSAKKSVGKKAVGGFPGSRTNKATTKKGRGGKSRIVKTKGMTRSSGAKVVRRKAGTQSPNAGRY